MQPPPPAGDEVAWEMYASLFFAPWTEEGGEDLVALDAAVKACFQQGNCAPSIAVTCDILAEPAGYPWKSIDCDLDSWGGGWLIPDGASLNEEENEVAVWGHGCAVVICGQFEFVLTLAADETSFKGLGQAAGIPVVMFGVRDD